MKPVIADVVARLRAARSLPWLRVLDAAQLDEPAVEESDPDTVVAPYFWLLRRIGSGVRLTQAGYLPPALVSEAMAALAWQDRWTGKHNREDQTLPILELRQSAQRLGLLRKYSGQLLPTRVGRASTADPAALWWHVAERLPLTSSEPLQQAGVLYLLTVAAGMPRDDVLLADGMWILGWAERGSPLPLSPSTAVAAARDTWAVLDRLGALGRKARWNSSEPSPTPAGIRLARAALVGRTQATSDSATEPRAVRRSALAGDAVHLLVTLRSIDPPIWRRLVVPASLTLLELHAVLQIAMGWQDSHLHLFEVADVLYGDTYDIDTESLGDEETFTLGQVVERVRQFRYDYDFGDNWEHDIQVEQVMASVGTGTPHLVGGARACPPEDVGGAWGYAELLEALADPTHDEHDDYLEWVGGDGYDSEKFDLTATNALLDLYDRQTRRAGRR